LDRQEVTGEAADCDGHVDSPEIASLTASP
jgi:hypothetical protein